MSTIGEWIKSADFKHEKHVPVIEVSGNPTSGEQFTVTVTVGKEIPHPNTPDHFIQWIKLYFAEDGGKVVYELGKTEFSAHGASVQKSDPGPAYTAPGASFHVTLNGSGTLMAESYCNIHGLWESSQKVSL